MYNGLIHLNITKPLIIAHLRRVILFKALPELILNINIKTKVALLEKCVSVYLFMYSPAGIEAGSGLGKV